MLGYTLCFFVVMVVTWCVLLGIELFLFCNNDSYTYLFGCSLEYQYIPISKKKELKTCLFGRKNEANWT
jgi:hypothetical protein